MTDVEQLLDALDARPPGNLERDTLVSAGAADQVTTTDSPVGPLWIAWNPRGITAVTPLFVCETLDGFLDEHRRNAYETKKMPNDLASRVDGALDRGETADVPVDLTGVPHFQRAVLEACCLIGPGTVRSYGWIADQLDNRGAVRAVGTALGKNPVPLIIPCHRVVRSDGSIGNYAFGPDMKHDLLVREGAILA